MTTRLAVLGSPIAHSKSPALHRAAYGVLGLDWQYDAIEVAAAELPAFIASRGPEWLGLSLTMPLKKDVVPLLDEGDALVQLSGVANTVVFDDGVFGFNTDISGIDMALRGQLAHTDYVVIVGGGATAVSALLAAAGLGFARALLLVRDPEKARSVINIMDGFVMTTEIGRIGDAIGEPDLVISTVPGHADVAIQFDETVRRSAVLFDVAYDPWPSTLANQWLAVGGYVISGLEMLAAQALSQVRIFVHGSNELRLRDEEAVWAAMRAAVDLPAPNGQ
jgi:shikimate dehydrogenase